MQGIDEMIADDEELMHAQDDDEQNDEWRDIDIDPAWVQGWTGDGQDDANMRDTDGGQGSDDRKRDREWNATDRGPGPGQKRRTQTMAMWQPSPWRRMRDALGSGLCVQACVSDANDPMHDNSETADVTGD